MGAICFKDLSIGISDWASKTTEGTGSLEIRQTGATYRTTAWMMSTPFPPNVRYEGDARLWRYFGPYLQDVTVRIRFHYRVPLMGGNGDTGNGWNYVRHGWITVPDIDPDIDVPPTLRAIIGGTPYGYGPGSRPNGIEWTVTEDQIIPAGTTMRYLVRLEPQIIFVGGAGSPSSEFPVLECDDEIVPKDPDTGLYPAFTVIPVSPAANDGTPLQILFGGAYVFDSGLPVSYSEFGNSVINSGNGNSNVISVQEQLNAIAVTRWPHIQDTITIVGSLGSLVAVSPPGGTWGVPPWTTATVTNYATRFAGDILPAIFSSSTDPAVAGPSSADRIARWRHWRADWY